MTEDTDDPFDALSAGDEEDPFEALPEADGEDPFELLDAGSDLGERTPASEEELFETVEVGSDPTEAPWEELVSDDDGVAGGVDATSVDETVVSKRRYCQGCEYLTDPPDVACTHPDGEILEVTDLEHFRVRNCPVVAYRREHSAYEDPGIGSDD